MPKKLRAIFLSLVLSLPALPVTARSVDVALVLAVDVSGSIDAERYELQLKGYTAAFIDPRLVEAIQSGPDGAIVVTLVQWSATGNHQQAIGWTLIDGIESARNFASAVSETPRLFFGATSISSAIEFSRGLFETSGVEQRRRVIDISGDGANNDGAPAAEARDAAVATGITINGLPILAIEHNLDSYYRDNVVGGPGAFVVAAKDFASFAQAILSKLLLEIADDSGSELMRLAAR